MNAEQVNTSNERTGLNMKTSMQ